MLETQRMPYFMASYETGGISHQAVGQFRIPYGRIDSTGLYNNHSRNKDTTLCHQMMSASMISPVRGSMTDGPMALDLSEAA
mgnify:CR=1 FL=1